MDNNKEIEVTQFLDISRKMLTSAKNNGWDELPDLEIARKKIMMSLFESGTESQDSAKLEQMIGDVVSINEQIEQLARDEKAKIGQQLHGLKKKQNVHSAYLQNK